MRYRKDVGDWGEDIACAFLRRQGFEIIERNFFAPSGEIDIVARHGGDFYFVEVKTRSSATYATDLAIDPIKRMRLEKSVKNYCYRRNVKNAGIILAGVIIRVDSDSQKAKIRFVVMH